VRRSIEQLARVRAAIQSAVGASPRGEAFDLSSALALERELEWDVLVLAKRAEYLARFSLQREQAALLDRTEEILQALDQLPAAITALQLQRIEACDSRPLGDGSNTTALIESFEALVSATRERAG
jgi:hypothetical protein